MLRFLKKIRKENVEKSKMKKVLVYAIGEIFLVVIGILIAVQLNNWNNQRRLDVAESITLQRLYEDLQSDLDRFEFLDSAMNYQVQICDTILQLIDQRVTAEELLNLIEFEPVYNFVLETNTATYDEMLNTGRLYSLSSRRLRSWTTLYYRQAKKWGSYSESNTARLNSAISQPILNDYWVIKTKLQQDLPVAISKYDWLTQSNSDELKAIEHLTYLTRSTLISNIDNYEIIRDIGKRFVTELEKHIE